MNGTYDQGSPGSRGRLLPWVTPEGNPCYLISDGTATGYLSRVADNIESVQLGMAVDLLDHAADMLADPMVTSAQIRFLADRMAESLRDVHRIAQSRGDRLPPPVDEAHEADEADEADETDETDEEETADSP